MDLLLLYLVGCTSFGIIFVAVSVISVVLIVSRRERASNAQIRTPATSCDEAEGTDPETPLPFTSANPYAPPQSHEIRSPRRPRMSRMETACAVVSFLILGSFAGAIVAAVISVLLFGFPT